MSGANSGTRTLPTLLVTPFCVRHVLPSVRESCLVMAVTYTGLSDEERLPCDAIRVVRQLNYGA